MPLLLTSMSNLLVPTTPGSVSVSAALSRTCVACQDSPFLRDNSSGAGDWCKRSWSRCNSRGTVIHPA